MRNCLSSFRVQPYFTKQQKLNSFSFSDSTFPKNMECLLPQIQLLCCIYITRRRQYSNFCSKFLTYYKLRLFPHPLSIFFFFSVFLRSCSLKCFSSFQSFFQRSWKKWNLSVFMKKSLVGPFFWNLDVLSFK